MIIDDTPIIALIVGLILTMLFGGIAMGIYTGNAIWFIPSIIAAAIIMAG